MLVLGSPGEWCSAIIASCVGVDIIPSQQHPHHFLMPILGSPRERCSTIFTFVNYIGVGVVQSQQHLHDPFMSHTAACESGVWPFWSALSGLTSFRSSIILTTASFPFRAAPKSGIAPNLSTVLELTSARSSSILTTRSCPFLAARQSSVGHIHQLCWD